MSGCSRRSATVRPGARVEGARVPAGRFSFNVKGGRCEACQGDGIMQDRDAVPAGRVRAVRGLQRQALQPRDAGDQVQRVVDRRRARDDRRRGAGRSSRTCPSIAIKLQTLVDVGLGYIQLGPARDDAVRRRGAAGQARDRAPGAATGRTMYILDEPTTGLHFADVERLLGVLARLVDAGNTVVVIEHNLDVIKTADWVIDLGPGGRRRRRPDRGHRHARGRRREPRQLYRPAPGPAPASAARAPHGGPSARKKSLAAARRSQRKPSERRLLRLFTRRLGHPGQSAVAIAARNTPHSARASPAQPRDRQHLLQRRRLPPRQVVQHRVAEHDVRRHVLRVSQRSPQRPQALEQRGSSPARSSTGAARQDGVRHDGSGSRPPRAADRAAKTARPASGRGTRRTLSRTGRSARRSSATSAWCRQPLRSSWSEQPDRARARLGAQLRVLDPIEERVVSRSRPPTSR